MTHEEMKLASKVWDKVAEREGSLAHVLSVQMSALRSDPMTKFVFGDIVGDTHANKAQRTYFMDTFYGIMPNVVFLSDENGKPNTEKRPTAVIWKRVDRDDLAKMNRAFMSYRYKSDMDAVVPERPIGHITSVEEIDKMIDFTYPSGYKGLIPDRDKDGNVIKVEHEVFLVPVTKSVWGHTAQVKDAFMKTIEFVAANPLKK